MILKFHRSHASILSFPTVDLPDFTVITGPNGSGKSHLLQAIYQGMIKTDIAPDQDTANKTQIRLFDWASMIPQEQGVYSSESTRSERYDLMQQYKSARSNQHFLEPVRTIVRNYGIEGEFLNDPAKLLNIPTEELVKIVGSDHKSNELRKNLLSALNGLENSILRNLDINRKSQLQSISLGTNRPIYDLLDDDIISPSIPTWGQTDFFQQSFGRLFGMYRDILVSNSLAELQASKGLKVAYLNDEQFIEMHGPAPWDFVNQSLLDAGLDFEISSPATNDYSIFQPVLRKRSSGIPIPFNLLSSGEKVLMSFAFCVYYSNDSRQLAVKPKILLLDEIDAPLHPSMSKNVIDTIIKTLVSKFGIKVIVTTHSPSTVALAPDESIYTMRPGQPGLHKTSKPNALNVLTIGVPTISLSYDGRRQVFVESPTDAMIYDMLYKLLKPQIDSERSLEFIATGTRVHGENGGDINTGCENVKRIVNALTAAGNSSVFGLLDWDGKHVPTERIRVLAYGTRNGIENLLLDPLLITIAIVHSFPNHRISIGLPDNFSYHHIISYSQDSLQKIVDIVTSAIFGDLSSERIASDYVGGLSLQIDNRYKTTDDHQLEEKILTAFPFLNSISRGKNVRLLQYLVDLVCRDNTNFIPIFFKEIFEEILRIDAHT